MRDKWGKDQVTGARGLEMGLRIVKDGMVKIGGEHWTADDLKKYEGQQIEVGCSDAWATEYTARNKETFVRIARLVKVKNDNYAHQRPRNPNPL